MCFSFFAKPSTFISNTGWRCNISRHSGGLKEARKLHEAVMNTPADPESDSLSVHEGTGAPKRSFCASVNNAGTNATHGCPSSTTLTQLVM